MAKKQVEEVVITDLDIERRAKLLVAYIEYTRWMLSFPKRRNHTFTGAVIIPSEAMLNIGIAFAGNSDSKIAAFGLSFNANEYGFLSEIGIAAAYWEEGGITLVLKSRILNLISVPFVRLHFEIESPVLLTKIRRYNKMFLVEVLPNGTVHGSSGFRPSRLYPELIAIKSDYSQFSKSNNQAITKVLG